MSNLNDLSQEARAVIAACLWLPARDRHRIVCSGTAWGQLTDAFPSETAAYALDGEVFDAGAIAPLSDTQAHARTSDPSTSHDAAMSLTPETLRKSQTAVLLCLGMGPATDEALVARYHTYQETMLWPKQSASGLRSRRSELTRADPPMVRDTGARGKLASGRKGIVWGVANHATIPAVSRNRQEEDR